MCVRRELPAAAGGIKSHPISVMMNYWLLWQREEHTLFEHLRPPLSEPPFPPPPPPPAAPPSSYWMQRCACFYLHGVFLLKAAFTYAPQLLLWPGLQLIHSHVHRLCCDPPPHCNRLQRAHARQNACGLINSISEGATSFSCGAGEFLGNMQTEPVKLWTWDDGYESAFYWNTVVRWWRISVGRPGS